MQSVSVSGQRVTLTLQSAAIGNDTVALTYRHKAKPTLRSASGVNAATVRNVAVEVLSPDAVVETFEPEEPRAASQVSGQAADDFIPTNFSATILNTGVRFTWDPPSSGTVGEYQLRHDTNADLENGATTVTIASDANPLRYDEKPGAGIAVYAQVRAQDSSDNTWGPWSHVLYATGNRPEDRAAPAAPAAPTVTPGDAQLTVTWTEPDDEGCSITRYWVQHQQSGATTWTENRNAWKIDSGGNLSYTISSLTNGQSYNVQVRADGLCGRGDWSDSTAGTPTAGTTQQPTDYDSNADGLIEISDLAQLDAIRLDLDGDGAADEVANNNAYSSAFPNAMADMGCPTSGCIGYELTADLDFDTNGNGSADSGDTYYDGGDGWTPIGSTISNPYTGDFDGTDRTISNLFVDRGDLYGTGLFGFLDGSTVSNLALRDVDITGGESAGGLVGEVLTDSTVSGVSVSGSVSGDLAGGLAGFSEGDITHSSSSAAVQGSGGPIGGLVGENAGAVRFNHATGAVSSESDTSSNIGGLVGKNTDVIAASYATGTVSGPNNIGGLVGENPGGSITASYATGAVSGTGSNIGGLVGDLKTGSVTASYATGAVSGTGSNIGGLMGDISTSGDHTDSYFDREATGRVFGIGVDDTTRSGVLTNHNNRPDAGEENTLSGHTGAELRGPTDYTGIYLNWNVDVDGESGDDPWDFGEAHNYPTLKNAGGTQQGPGPVQSLNVAEVGGQARVTWSAPSGTTGITYELRHLYDDGSGSASWSGWAAATSPHNLALPAAGQTLRVEVRAVGTAAHSRSQASSGSVDGPAVQTDYDSDADGLIGIANLAQLNAIRLDLDGDGVADSTTDNSAYATAFPSPVAGMGCPSSGCVGYELTANLDFDTNGNGSADSGDTYWNNGAGWLPIAGTQNIDANDGFQATFEGNDHTISNLFINREYDVSDYYAGYRIGLFGAAGEDAVIRNLNLTDVDVTGDEEVGGLVGINLGDIDIVSVTGSVSGASIDVGGLVGFSWRGSVLDSSFDGDVSGRASHIGGLVGANGATIRYSSAAGTVSGSSSNVGGLAGSNTGTIAASFATNSVTANSALWVGGLVGRNGGPYTRGHGSIIACYSSGNVSGRDDVGGLVGENYGSISFTYSTGSVSRQSSGRVGGLVGRNEWRNHSRDYATATDSYWNADDTAWNFGVSYPDDANNNNRVDTGETNTLPGHTTSALQSPTHYSGIYADWDVDVDGDGVDDDPWDFGTDSEYPELR